MLDQYDLTVENMWNEFMNMAELSDMRPKIIERLKYVFYCGFKAMWETNLYHQTNAESVEQYKHEIKMLDIECEKFIASVIAETKKPSLEIVKK